MVVDDLAECRPRLDAGQQRPYYGRLTPIGQVCRTIWLGKHPHLRHARHTLKSPLTTQAPYPTKDAVHPRPPRPPAKPATTLSSILTTKAPYHSRDAVHPRPICIKLRMAVFVERKTGRIAHDMVRCIGRHDAGQQPPHSGPRGGRNEGVFYKTNKHKTRLPNFA